MSANLELLLDAERRADCARNDAAMETGRRIVPLHTGRVQIGIAYQPRPNRLEGDAIAIQRALLAPEQPAGLRRIFAFFRSL